MKFQTAMTWMIRAGKKIAAPGFIGYWFWDEERKEIIIVTKNNEHIPMSQSNNWELTLGFMCGDEWELYNGPDDPRDSEEYANLFGDKLMETPFKTELTEQNAHLFSKEKGWEKSLLANMEFDLVKVSDVYKHVDESQPIEIGDDFRIEKINTIIDGRPHVFRLSDLDKDALKVDDVKMSPFGVLSHTVRIAISEKVTIAFTFTLDTKTAMYKTATNYTENCKVDSFNVVGSFKQ